MEGETVSHLYASVGTYSVKIVALGGAAATVEEITEVTLTDPLLLPLDFESPTIDYSFSNFDGGVVTKIANSQISGINESANVAQMVKYAGQPWGGSWIALSEAIDFSTKKYFKMKVFSPRVGAKVFIKVENLSDGNIKYFKEELTTVANEWEELTFDFTGIDATQSYQKIVLIFDNGIMGDGTDNFTFLFDDLRQAATSGITTLYDFEASPYTFNNFDGGVLSVIANPQSMGMNTSANVAQMVKSAGQTWGGSWFDYGTPIDFSAQKTVKMKVFSPRIGANVLFKVENLSNGNIKYFKTESTTVANDWELLTFDFSGIDATQSYQKIVIIFDNGTMGDGTDNFTFLIDDITLN